MQDLSIASFAGNEAIVQFVPFVDFGTVWNIEAEGDLEPDTIVALGAGLQFNFNDSFNARIDWGIPLVDPDTDSDTLQENGIYFSIDYQL
ncbi:MAG: BamA/TamA family outer membrane protein [Xenococcaceae cyanobacterium]